MVKVKVSVKLDGDPKHYVVDESGYITGDVEVETEDDLHADLFTVRFSGGSWCAWSHETSNGMKWPYCSTYCIIDETINISHAKEGKLASLGSPTGCEGYHIKPGISTYQFSFKYCRLPSSMSEFAGGIGYSIEVALEPKGRKNTIKLKEPIEIVSQDLYINHSDTGPVSKKDVATNTLFCCIPRGTVSATVTLQEATLGLGTSCVVTLDVINNTGRTLVPKVKLKRLTVYRAYGQLVGERQRTREDIKEVHSLILPIIGGSVNYTRTINLPIDKDVVPLPVSIPNISSTYFIVVKLLGGPKLRFKFHVNIVANCGGYLRHLSKFEDENHDKDPHSQAYGPSAESRQQADGRKEQRPHEPGVKSQRGTYGTLDGSQMLPYGRKFELQRRPYGHLDDVEQRPYGRRYELQRRPHGLRVDIPQKVYELRDVSQQQQYGLRDDLQQQVPWDGLQQGIHEPRNKSLQRPYRLRDVSQQQVYGARDDSQQQAFGPTGESQQQTYGPLGESVQRPYETLDRGPRDPAQHQTYGLIRESQQAPFEPWDDSRQSIYGPWARPQQGPYGTRDDSRQQSYGLTCGQWDETEHQTYGPRYESHQRAAGSIYSSESGRL